MLDESDGPRGRSARDESSSSTAPLLGSRIVRSAMVVSVVRTGGIVLIDVAGGRRITLDPFGSRIWALLADKPTLSVLVERLHDHETRAEQLVRDLLVLLARWRDMNIVTWR
jgi:uncharacterized membrane protein YhaH (DUF805 family)